MKIRQHNNSPLISVIMTTYNPAKDYIQDTVRSIIGQTYSHWELYIINDCSDEPIEPFLTDIMDKRIHIINMSQNYGPGYCRNYGIKRCNGEFVAIIDDDDIALPQRFEKQLSLFLSDPLINVVGSYAEFFGDKTGLLCPELPKTRAEQQVRLLLENASIPNPSAMLRKSFILENNLSYKENIRSAEDYAFWVDIVQYTPLYCIKEPLIQYRRHASQITSSKIEFTQNCADQVKWAQLQKIELFPTVEEKELHNKLCRLLSLDKDDLYKMPIWIEKIIQYNNKQLYFDSYYLKKWLYSRMCTLSLRYFKANPSFLSMFLILKYLRFENIKHVFGKIITT